MRRHFGMSNHLALLYWLHRLRRALLCFRLLFFFLWHYFWRRNIRHRHPRRFLSLLHLLRCLTRPTHRLLCTHHCSLHPSTSVFTRHSSFCHIASITAIPRRRHTQRRYRTLCRRRCNIIYIRNIHRRKRRFHIIRICSCRPTIIHDPIIP